MSPADNDSRDTLERLRSRYFGKYRGVVTDIDADTCRIKARVPAVLGDVPTGWCLPCVPYAGNSVGIAFLPETDSGVWIEFEGGDVSYPIWVGGYWRQGEVPDGVAADVKVIATTSGLTVTFDDGEQTLTLADNNGNTVSLSSDGITLSNGGQQVIVSSTSVAVNDDALVIR